MYEIAALFTIHTGNLRRSVLVSMNQLIIKTAENMTRTAGLTSPAEAMAKKPEPIRQYEHALK